MCYKIEKQRKIEQKLAKELKDIPDFILRFERAGFTKIKAVQLPSNKSEIMVYGGK